MSQSPCWRRINRLQESGVIRQVALLDRERLGMDVAVFASVNLTQSGRKNYSPLRLTSGIRRF